MLGRADAPPDTATRHPSVPSVGLTRIATFNRCTFKQLDHDSGGGVSRYPAQWALIALVLTSLPVRLPSPQHDGGDSDGNRSTVATPTAPTTGDHVTFYALNLRFDPADSTVSGRVVIRALLDRRSGDSLRLDLAPSMIVDSVTDGRDRLVSIRAGAVVAIAVNAAAIQARTATVDVFYHGRPTDDALVFGQHAGAAVVSSYGLPYSARQWWPCRDTPADKADSADIEITAPAPLTAASNGRFISRQDNGDGTATTRWSVRYPIYADVIAVDVSNYQTFTLMYHGTERDSMPMPFFVFPEDATKAQQDFSVLPAMLAHHVRLFGPYPFAREKYGVVEMAQNSFREHQTLPGYGPRFITGDHRNDGVLAHELAHQWFGNALTVRNWSDVWLNEGFATYAALLWREDVNGEADYVKAVRDRMIPAVYTGTVYVADSTNVESMFTATTFNKGALVLHMLRHVMGDSAFFRALKRYVSDNIYHTVTTPDFVRATEREYGHSLEWFFREWVYRGGAPAYEASVSAVHRGGAGYDVDVTIRQTQADSVFRMPLDVALATKRGAIRRTAWDTARVQHLRLAVADSATAVAIDPDDWVIKAVKSGAERVGSP